MRRLSAALAAIGFAACQSSSVEPPNLGQRLSQLQPVASCPDLLAHLKARVVQQMNKELDRNLDAALKSQGFCWQEDFAGGNSASPSSDGVADTKDKGASQYSTTNNQVEGVDEADFLKNDDHFFYLATHGELQILDVWPPEQAHVLSHFKVEGQVSKLFVESDRAVVYSSLAAAPASSDGPAAPWASRSGSAECTYGYDCDFVGDGRPAKLTVLDISDRASPKLLREIRFTGSYINARRLDNAVYTVVSSPELKIPGLKYWPDDLPYCSDLSKLPPEQIRAEFEALRPQNESLIAAAELTDWLPSATDTIYVDGQPQTRSSLLNDCQGYYESQIDDGKSFLTLAGFDLKKDSPLSLSTIVGRPGAVYASGDSLYVAARHQPVMGQGWFFELDEVAEATSVHKFRLANAAVGYVGSGAVKGRVLNQFSMDEYQGALRIATTTGHLPSPDVHSTVSVLLERAGSLEAVGTLDGLAPGEDIRSARFDGAKGFAVTFKKTDPLFVLDLSDPSKPSVAGELKIPGFSTYLHLMDPTHLLSIGYDADDQGSFAWFTGVQLQIFDIGEAKSPRLVHKEVIGTRGTSSEALTNHLAFTYFAPKHVLAIPMVVCEGGSGGSFGDQMTFSGLMVYDATVESGFSYRGGIAHMPSQAVASCSNWWSQAGSPVKRSVIMDDYVFSVADDVVKAAALADLKKEIAVVPLAAAP
jgi:uncharacterized secreted protein with C-terminal beta-propeller domain